MASSSHYLNVFVGAKTEGFSAGMSSALKSLTDFSGTMEDRTERIGMSFARLGKDVGKNLSALGENMKKMNVPGGNLVGQLGVKAPAAIGKMGGSLGRLTGILAKLPGWFKVAAAAVAGLTAAYKVAAAAGAKFAGVARLASDLGANTTEFGKLAYITRSLGLEVEDASEAFKELKLRAGEAVLDGTGPAAEMFNKLGIDAERFSKLGVTDQFTTLSKSVRALDEQTRSFALDELFGGDANKLLPLFKLTEREIYEIGRTAVDTGYTIEQSIADTAVAAERSGNRASLAWEGVANSLSRILIGPLAAVRKAWEALSTLTAMIIKAIIDGITFVGGLFGDLTVKAVRWVAELEPVVAAVDGIADAWRGVSDAINDATIAMLAFIPGGKVAEAGAGVQKQLDNFDRDLIRQGKRMNRGAGKEVAEGVMGFAALPDRMAAGITGLLGGTPDPGTIRENLEGGLRRFVEAIPKLPEKIGEEMHRHIDPEKDHPVTPDSRRDGATVAKRGSVEAVSAVIAARRGNAETLEARQAKAMEDAVKLLKQIAKAGAPIIEGLRLA